MGILRYFVFVLIVGWVVSCEQKRGVIEQLMRESDKFDHILENVEKHKLQIIYTQIDRDENNKANFTTFKFRVDDQQYFYPASSIKLPVAVLALEKINNLDINGLTPFSDMLIDSTFSGQSRAFSDSSSNTGLPSVSNYIKKLFIVSDNDAYNRLYEFIGQAEANATFIKKGYNDIRIAHRLEIHLTPEENRHTNPISFFNDGELVYKQNAVFNEVEVKSDKPILLGKGYMEKGNLIREPKDFTFKNAIGLESLHKVLLSILFPENFSPEERFNLTENDYKILYEHMSKYPQESDFPNYGDKYTDDYCKFLMFAGTNHNIDKNIRIYNKIGQAYGFLIDMAYIIDLEKKIEFVLGAVIYVNANEIFGDDNYEYESIGYPIMTDLGQLFYDYEVKRGRAYAPDLSRYNWKSWEK